MTKKHFIAIARIISQIDNNTIRRNVRDDFCEMFRKENSRFDRQRFVDAVDGERAMQKKLDALPGWPRGAKIGG
tara:strand:- start:439 stop:660 length:222 start_codon:yes stop_codon:yes gene_type:complete